jgi:hypothetical protein
MGGIVRTERPVQRSGARPLSTPFDEALEQRELREAAQAYASRYGELGTPAYREAWFRFRERIRTSDDLRRARDARRRSVENGPDS